MVTMGGRVGSWLLALLVVGALGVGGVLAASSSGSRRPPVLQLAGGSQVQATADGAGVAARAQPGWPAVRYQLPKDLPDLPAEARAWRLVPRVGEDRVAALARALGFGARPTATQGGWRVFERDRFLQVTRDFGAPWTYLAGVGSGCTRGRQNPDGAVGSDAVACPAGPGGHPCPRATACAQPRSEPEPAAASGSSSPAVTGTGRTVPPSGGPAVACRPGQVRPACPWPPPRPADLPGRDQAERIARDWLARAAVPLDHSTVRVVQQWDRWVVDASPTVDGRPTVGDAAEVWVGAKGAVVGGSGWLSEPQAGASYPLTGVRQAVDRLQQRRLWFAGSLAPVPPCANPAGLRCAQPRTVRRVTGVRLGLQQTVVLAAGDRAGRDAWLVPAYFLEIDGNPDQVDTVIAVADRYLRIPQPRPAPAPRPLPVPPLGGGTPGSRPAGG
jgi:hypothetical protein